MRSMVELIGTETQAQRALELLQTSLPIGQRVVIVKYDTAERLCAPPKAHYDTWQYGIALSALRRREGIFIDIPDLSVYVPAQPLHHHESNRKTEQYSAQICKDGDFIHIVAPYYFYEDCHRVDVKKFTIHTLSGTRAE